MKNKKKTGLQSDFVRFCAQTFCPRYKRGRAMPQFYTLFYANYTILATQRGRAWCHGLPLNTPLISTYIISSDLFYFSNGTKKISSAMSQNKNSKRNATFTIAEVALDIFLHVARQRRVTAKHSLLKIACLMTVSFRPSWDHIHNLN